MPHSRVANPTASNERAIPRLNYSRRLVDCLNRSGPEDHFGGRSEADHHDNERRAPDALRYVEALHIRGHPGSSPDPALPHESRREHSAGATARLLKNISP